MFAQAPLWLWATLHLVLIVLIASDGWLWRAQNKAVADGSFQPLRPALAATALWIAAALLFSLGIAHTLGWLAATQYLAGYGMEQSLSIDNLFVFLLLFRTLHLDARQQRRVFFWGLAGAILLRTCALAAGVALFQKFFWVQLCMGLFLLAAAVHMLLARRREQQPGMQQMGWMGKLAQRMGVQLAPQNSSTEPHFWNKPFLAALLLVQIADLLFAVDSIPAVLAVTHNFFLVYASNVFALIGMRALYFVLAGLLERLAYLHYGLATILLLAGGKLLLSSVWPVPASATLAALAAILAVTAAASLRQMRHS